jgi:hypothetical protein
MQLCVPWCSRDRTQDILMTWLSQTGPDLSLLLVKCIVNTRGGCYECPSTPCEVRTRFGENEAPSGL